MLNTQEILQFNFSQTTFRQSAEKIIPQTLNALLDIRIDKLQKINDRLASNPLTSKPIFLIPEVYKKFKNYINIKNTNFERRELRTLTYALNYSERNTQSIFSNVDELQFALNLLESEWRDPYLSGLIDNLLSNWETKNQKSLEVLEQFITKKLDGYTDTRNTLLSFKNNKRYFNTKNGDLILGDTIAKLNKPIQEATKILGVPESWLTYPYFSKVIVTYYERNKNKIFDEIKNLNDVLLKHNSSITNKRLISKLIIQINQPQFTTLQDKIKKIAFTLIGDPSNISNWSVFENSTETERREIIEGRNILNEWITQQFINVFFNVCINDDRRKKFWLRFASKISSFKVYGPLYTKSILKRDERISEYVDARFETVSSRRDVSAFILYIEDYMFIEFSNEGYAFYAYKINSPYKPSLSYQLNSVDDLRNSSMPMAIQSDANYEYFNDEGRLTHRDGNQIWETRFNNWIKQKVLIDKTTINDYTTNISKVETINSDQSVKTWESPLCYWSSVKLPGYQYSEKNKAWWKSKK